MSNILDRQHTDTFVDFDNLPPNVEAFFFHGGEPHVKIPEYTGNLTVKANINTWEEFGPFLAFLSAVGHQDSIGNIRLYLPYFPGARQDRTDHKSPLTVEMYAAAIKGALSHTKAKVDIYTFDMHSQLGFAIAGNIFADSDNPFMFYNLEVDHIDISKFDKDIDYVIAPDAGAVPRASKFAAAFYPKAKFLRCEKKRDFETGQFTGFTFPERQAEDKPGKMLVVDDICDGGGTFSLLSYALDLQWRKTSSEFELQLYVSHGIFSKTPEVLEDDYTKIYTTDSFPHPFYNIDFPSVVEIPVPNLFKLKEVN